MAEGGRPFTDITNQEFRTWRAVSYLGQSNWLCRCKECGREATFLSNPLRNLQVRTCKHRSRKEKGVSFGDTKPGVACVLKDRIGQEYGFLTPVEYLGHRSYRCNCLCGKEFVKTVDHLNTYAKANTPTCPDRCKRTCSIPINPPQGLSPLTKEPLSDPECRQMLRRRLQNIKSRCYYTKAPNYRNYGARGIKVCDQWLVKNGSQAFVEYIYSLYPDIAELLQAGYTIDRIDNDGNYEPGNIRVVDRVTQNRNRRPQKRSA